MGGTTAGIERIQPAHFGKGLVEDSIGLRSLTGLLMDVAGKIGREINPHALTEKEFTKRKADQDHFLTMFWNHQRSS